MGGGSVFVLLDFGNAHGLPGLVGNKGRRRGCCCWYRHGLRGASAPDAEGAHGQHPVVDARASKHRLFCFD